MTQESSDETPRRPHPGRILRLGMILSLGLAGGCGAREPLNRQAISGVISVDGRALDDGAILLEPLATDGSGLAVGATIRRGSFAIAQDQGPPPGPYRVRIYSSSGFQDPPGQGQSEQTRRPMVERLPEIYNKNSELRMDVVDGGPNRLRLELSGDGRR